MKIEIQNTDLSGCNGYRLYDLDNRKFIENCSRNLDKSFFDEEDISNLLNSSDFRKFLDGAKFTFTITKKQIFSVSQNFNYYSLPY
jgi:hypothetical protein